MKMKSFYLGKEPYTNLTDEQQSGRRHLQYLYADIGLLYRIYQNPPPPPQSHEKTIFNIVEKYKSAIHTERNLGDDAQPH